MRQDCFLVIDLLNDFLDRRSPEDVTRLVSKTNELVSAFRSANYPIVWVRQAFMADLSDAFLEWRDQQFSMTIEGTRGSRFHSELARLPTDPVVTKKRYSAFFGTNLDSLLDQLGVSHITLAGVNTHECVRMAAIDAYQRDFRLTIARECVHASHAEHARITLEYLKDKMAAILTNDEIIRSLSSR
jgi:maleamate amidohydrolase